MAAKERNTELYGARPVIEALQSGKQLEKILLKKNIESELRKEVQDLASQHGVQVQMVPVEKLDRLVPNGNHQGVYAYMALIHYVDLEDLLISLDEREITPLLLVLDQVSDVRNFGAIARTAECMGAHGIVVPQSGSARINSDAIKISAGALHYLPVCRSKHVNDALFVLKQYGVRVVSVTEKASNSLYEEDLSGGLALILGAEDRGISTGVLKRSDAQVRIPMQGKIASLNVSVAAGMALSEACRQRLSS